MVTCLYCGQRMRTAGMIDFQDVWITNVQNESVDDLKGKDPAYFTGQLWKVLLCDKGHPMILPDEAQTP